MSAIIHNPNVKQVNFLDERFYTDDHVIYYPSVTTVLQVYPKGKGFLEWLKKVGASADDIVEEAGQQGTKVHDTIQSLCNGEQIFWATDAGAQFTELEWVMLNRFKEFFDIYKPKLIAVEVKLLCHAYKIGMTIDWVVEIDGVRWVIDHKSGKYIHPSHELQIAGYATFWNKEHPDLRVDRTGILHLQSTTRGADKSGKSIQGKGWKLITEKDFGRTYYDAFRIYEHTRAIWDEENPNYKPKNLIYPDRLQLENLQSITDAPITS